MPRYGTIDVDYAGRLATCPADDDGPVLMVNFMNYRERADYDDGTDGGRSGREADDEYAPVDVLADIGAVVAYFGDVVDDRTSTGWHRIGIVQYPTRRSFIEMQSRRDFREKHQHKEAGMDHTIVFGVPAAAVTTGAAVGGTAKHVVFDLVRRSGEPTTPGALQAVGPVEGTIMGDGRTWTELRITWVTDEELAADGTVAPGIPDAVDAVDAVDDRERVVVRTSIDRLRHLLTTAREA